MNTPLLQGIVPAIATPLRAGGHEIDDERVGPLVEFLVDAGVHGLFALGSTGESVLLEPALRRHMAELVLQETRGRLPVFVQVGALRPAEVISLARHAAEIGAAGIAVLPPCFYGLDDVALEPFFASIAEAVTLPIYLYHIPMNAKNRITLSLFTRLADRYPHIRGVKDSSMDFFYFQDLVRAKRPEHTAMMGNDSQILPALAIGGSGAVSAGATAVPEPYVRLWNAWHAGDLAGSRKWQDVCTAVRAMFVKPYPIAPIKRVLELRGVIGPDVAPPLRGLSATESASLEKDFAAIREALG